MYGEYTVFEQDAEEVQHCVLHQAPPQKAAEWVYNWLATYQACTDYGEVFRRLLVYRKEAGRDETLTLGWVVHCTYDKPRLRYVGGDDVPESERAFMRYALRDVLPFNVNYKLVHLELDEVSGEHEVVKVIDGLDLREATALARAWTKKYHSPVWDDPKHLLKVYKCGVPCWTIDKTGHFATFCDLLDAGEGAYLRLALDDDIHDDDRIALAELLKAQGVVKCQYHGLAEWREAKVIEVWDSFAPEGGDDDDGMRGPYDVGLTVEFEDGEREYPAVHYVLPLVDFDAVWSE